MKKLVLLAVSLLSFCALQAQQHCKVKYVYDKEGNVYNTVQIGKQCWLRENLNMGTMLLGKDSMTDNKVLEKYCYDDDTANCAKYSGLYQWNEMMQYTLDEGTQGICPGGFHIPTDAEWYELEHFVDSTINDATAQGFRGTDGGTQLQETTGLGFSALLAGGRLPDGKFNSGGSFGIYWSSTQGPTGAWARDFTNMTVQNMAPKVGRYDDNKQSGFCVRCIMNR